MVESGNTTSSGFIRRSNPLETVLAEVGRALQVLDGSMPAGRPNPAGPKPMASEEQESLSPAERRHAAGLMRVNHVGEICAQALYRGQAMFCEDESIKTVLHRAAAEEVDHLVWCRERIEELGSRPSLLNPLWYLGSLSLGAAAERRHTSRNLGLYGRKRGRWNSIWMGISKSCLCTTHVHEKLSNKCAMMKYNTVQQLKTTGLRTFRGL